MVYEETIIFLISVSVFIFGLWLLFDVYRFPIMKGALNRGIKIAEESIPSHTVKFLLELQKDIVEYNGWDIPTKFIAKSNNEVIIRSKVSRGSPVIGYINLDCDSPRIEFRMSKPELIMVILMIISIVGAPFFILYYYINFRLHKNWIMEFLAFHLNRESPANRLDY